MQLITYNKNPTCYACEEESNICLAFAKINYEQSTTVDLNLCLKHFNELSNFLSVPEEQLKTTEEKREDADYEFNLQVERFQNQGAKHKREEQEREEKYQKLYAEYLGSSMIPKPNKEKPEKTPPTTPERKHDLGEMITCNFYHDGAKEQLKSLSNSIMDLQNELQNTIILIKRNKSQKKKSCKT